jgi:hypothetical protein
MAQPSTITNEIRRDLTKVLDALVLLDSINDKYVWLGGQPFFEAYLEDAQGDPTTDITTAEFVTAIASVQTMLTWLDTNGPSLSKLRI